MADERTTRESWQLGREALELLLGHLDDDRDRAAHKYEDLRRRLIVFFEVRRAAEPEVLADATIDRLSRKLQQGAHGEALTSFAYGIARLVLLEEVRQRRSRQEAHEEWLAVQALNTESELLPYLRQCLAALPPETRQTLLEYYEDDKSAKIEGRRAMAERLQVPLNALRIRMHRVRAKIEECVRHGWESRL